MRRISAVCKKLDGRCVNEMVETAQNRGVYEYDWEKRCAMIRALEENCAKWQWIWCERYGR